MDVRTLASYRLNKPELAVFVAGIASMGLEILAGRVIAPQFGSSIYTWGSIITICLAALSLGYWQGGKRAKTATNREMSWILLGTAIYIAIVIYASDLLLLYTSTMPLGARYASIPAVIALFGPPTYLLGFISPYGAELCNKEGVGEASGHVYAVGTIGSILGSALTTFVLIPELSVERIGLLFGFLLVATALALTLPDFSRNSAGAAVVVSLLLVGAAVGSASAFDPRGDVIYQTHTGEQELEVIDDGDTRTMYLDGARHSAMDMENPDRHVFEYTTYFNLPLLMNDGPEEMDDVLFIGGGGYTGPQEFEAEYDVNVDVVELDGDVTDAAEEYFGLEHGENLTTYEDDGRQYLAEMDDSHDGYDLIVLDAYKKDQVPFQLTTVEFMELISDRLAEDGILTANVVSSPTGSAAEFYHAQYKTIDQVFPDVYSFRTSDRNSVQNVQVVATKEETDFSQVELEQRNDQRDLAVDLEGALDNYMDEPDTDGAPLLEDDYAPVDRLLDPMMGQRYVIEESDDPHESEATASSSAMAPIAHP
ncbi:fused MFS/spermidine synthase [Halostagnicola sp. A-GB9-2]|uniref:spermidine synthase n=1 Tax=Halostagnicola sp. A-GB9-2 TaxID=3048066 RepID=UPI0024BF33E5|nr:fused MFS/spermidine synthase [Halostagnicola sp. A-GB9-2]MDJ1432587.1 fused MFS/spermidine synthase [Halostagnicola sp. A-GB9-2]